MGQRRKEQHQSDNSLSFKPFHCIDIRGLLQAGSLLSRSLSLPEKMMQMCSGEKKVLVP